jgi:superfamily I DNA/RNA helicase
VAVIAPHARVRELGEALADLEGCGFADDPDALDAAVLVLTVEQSKGLEFDSVVIVLPDEILDESDNGTRDLYVALTRATQRLGILHLGELPPMLGRARAGKT